MNTLTENQYQALLALRDCPDSQPDHRTGKALVKKGFAILQGNTYEITEIGLIELWSQEESEQGFIYVLKLDKPLNNTLRDAWFYIGFALNVEGRFFHHMNGTGASFTRAARAKGINLEVILTIPGTRAQERRIKNSKNILPFLQNQGIDLTSIIFAS